MKIHTTALTITAALLAGTLSVNARPQQQSKQGKQVRQKNNAECPCCHQPLQRQRGQRQEIGQQKRGGQQYNRQGRAQQNQPARRGQQVKQQRRGQQWQPQQLNRRGSQMQRGYANQAPQQFNRQHRGQQGPQAQQYRQQARAEQGPQSTHIRKQQMTERRKKVLKRFDHDGDGKLSDAEKAELKEAMKNRAQKRNQVRMEKPENTIDE